MRKMLTLIAAAALAASPFAFAEDTATTGNPNDVLQTVTDEGNGPTIADASSTEPKAPDVASAGDSPTSGNSSADEGTPPPKHHKHHVKHHHYKHHHHHKAAAPSSDTHMSKEQPNSTSGTDMSAPAAAPTGQ